MSFPKATVETAAAFVKLLVETGVLGQTMGPNQLECEDSFETLMPRAMRTVETFPGYHVPFREVWLQAMEVISVETRMRAVIDAVSAVPAAAVATVEQVTESVESVAPKRRRVAV